MNNTETNTAGVLEHLASLNHCSEVAQYALRVEWESDCFAIRAVLAPWLVIWREDQAYLNGPKGRCWLPDRDVVFSLRDGPSLEEVRWLIEAIADCHVASQSLSEAASYTGERLRYDEMDDNMRRPTDRAIAMARDSARNAQSFFADQFDRFEEAARRFDAALLTAAKRKRGKA